MHNITPRAEEALSLIAAEPGLSIEELGRKLGISLSRTWQLIAQLEYGRIRRNRALG